MPRGYFFLRCFLFVLIIDLSEKIETLTRMMLISINIIKENIVVFSVPGIGFLIRRIYPKMVKTSTVIDMANVKMAEDVLRILVDL